VVDENLNFVLSQYEQYCPMYISMSYSLSYALSFAAVTAIVVHTYLYNGSEIWAKFKNSRAGGRAGNRAARAAGDPFYLVEESQGAARPIRVGWRAYQK
jgi:hypothetical protein